MRLNEHARQTLDFTGEAAAQYAPGPVHLTDLRTKVSGRQWRFAQPSFAVEPVEDLICAALRGENPPWPWGTDITAAGQLCHEARVHGVAPLLHAQLRSSDWPLDVLSSLREEALQHAMWELRHQQLLGQALAAMASAGIEPVLIKGTALAYSLYPDAASRTRSDTDLIISQAAKAEVHARLLPLGFQRSLAVTGEAISYQASYTFGTSDGGKHALDLHWKINNSEVLSALFTCEELRQDAQAVPTLCPGAWAASSVHALLIACMHRATHRQNPYRVQGEDHHTANRLIWLYDIHLLAETFSVQQWSEFVLLAQLKGLRAVCLDGMQHAQARFGTTYPPAVVAALAQPGPPEKPAIYLEGGPLRQQCMDFVALGGIARQARFVRELLFPSRSYMRAKFPASSQWMLPWLYVWRSLSGAARRLARARKS